MGISLYFRRIKSVHRYLWSLGVIALFYICAASFSQAQIGVTCDTTAIYQPGHGWVQGSEQTSCTPAFSTPNDGFIGGDGGDGSCGGGPCPTAPEDTDEGLSDEQKCQIEQAVESERDELARDIAGAIMRKRDWKKREYGAVIIRNSAGEIRTTELFRGGATHVNFDFTLNGGDTILAAVHNHTQFNYDNATGPSDSDWKIAKEWVGNEWAQANAYSEYIVSETGAIAEFDYSKDFGKKESRNSDRKDAKSEC